MTTTAPIKNVKLIHRTAGGSLVRSDAMLEYADGRISFLKSPFALKDEIKAMKGSKWHGFESENPRKIWSVDDCQRNRFQLGYLMGEDVYAWFDREVQRHRYDRPLMEHQKDLADWFLTYHYGIMGAEMGCVDGDTLVHVSRAGRGFQCTLAHLFHKFYGGKDRGRSWDAGVPTFIRSLCGDRLGLNRVRAVLHKGKRPVYTLTLASGKSVTLTEDHEVYTGYRTIRPLGALHVGDAVLSNGVRVGENGYVSVPCRNHPRAGRRGTMHEHVLVMEAALGRYLRDDEVVHHRNGVKHDNRLENLELMLDAEHRRMHATMQVTNLHNGGRVQFVPRFDTVSSIEPAGVADVYDVVMADPYRSFVANGVVVSNCGKTLAAQEVMEKSGIKDWWWVGPKTSLPNIQREFRRWNIDLSLRVEMMNYEALVRVRRECENLDPVPQGVIFDESSRLKTASSQRTQAAQWLADLIREKYGYEGYVILMSGTPSPKSPLDWWSQTEIAWPGFLKEGSPKALEQPLAFLVDHQYDEGVFKKRVGWRDDERKCNRCGMYKDEGPHTLDEDTDPEDYHPFEPSSNEVAYLHQRLKGLVIVKHKKDCLTLPEKRYRKIVCKPNASTLRVAKALVDSAPNTITGLTLLRELSDGFQYREVAVDGTTPCPACPGARGTVHEWFDPAHEDRVYGAIDMLDPELVARLKKREVTCPRCGGSGEVPKKVRVTKEVPCPKGNALRELLDECEETGRIVVFAGFTGSVDRITKICRHQGWDVVRCDGRGFAVLPHTATSNKVGDEGEGPTNATATEEAPLDYWSNLADHPRVAFVAHPESGGMSLTLVESRMAVFWSNSFKPEYRIQGEDRVHRKGMDENKGCVIVDLVHLPTDEKVLDIIRENRRIELMTLGEVMEGVNWDGGSVENAD